MGKQTQSEVGAAAQAVAAVEALPLGSAWSEVEAQARQAIELQRAEAFSALNFDRVVPVGRDVAADLELLGAPRLALANLAQLHGEALQTHRALAEALRSRIGFDLARAAAARSVLPDPREILSAARARAHQMAGREFAELIAASLAAKGEGMPHSGALAALPMLEGRLAAAAGRHQERARAEAERVAREQREAEAVLAKARREDLCEWFARHFNVTFVDRGAGAAATTGGTVTELLRSGAMSIDDADELRSAYIAKVQADAARAGVSMPEAR